MKRLPILVLSFTLLALSGCGREALPTLAPTALDQPQTPIPEPRKKPEPKPVPPWERAVDAKLFDVWDEETAIPDPVAVARANEETLSGLEHAPVDPKALPFSEAQAIEAHRVLDTNIVTSERSKYEQPGTSIGYCFGRAMFVHLWALKNHYRKDQIRKIWAVGSMKTWDNNWGFHVATMIRDGATGEWRIVDSYLRAPSTPRAWIKVFQAQNKEKQNLRFYITAPEKFTPNLGKYSRTQLGLDMTREKDWYKHYFTDMMQTLKIRKKLAEDAEASLP
ncbi:MAG: hypothetical protein EOP11_08455 [Proteobacteria bacterium]|nr:MAG: hypothetical protein EOP11_08455 [Pseudomonadota bacterium]